MSYRPLHSRELKTFALSGDFVSRGNGIVFMKLELEKKTGKSVVSPLNAKNILGLQPGAGGILDVDSEEIR